MNYIKNVTPSKRKRRFPAAYIDRTTKSRYSSKVDLKEKYKAAKDVISSEMDNEAVLMNVKKGMYFSLNETSLFLWRKLEKEEMSLQEMILSIQDEYEIEERQCRLDLEQLLSSMLEKGVLEKTS